MGDKNFMGGLMGGLAQGMQQQQEFALKKDYQKSVMDINKLHGKLFEAQAKMAELKAQGVPKTLIDALNATDQGAAAAGQAANAPVATVTGSAGPGPQAAVQPQGPMWGPGSQSVPQQMAQGQIQPGSGMVQMTPEGQMSTRNNNPYNVKWPGGETNQALFASYGGQPGEGGFTKFATPEAGAGAAAALIQKDYANKTIAQAIETFAPTWQNPTTPQRIRETSQRLGVSPDTPVNAVPLGAFMQSQVKYESPTQINPAFWGDAGNTPVGQSQNRPAAQGQPQQGQGGPQLISPNFPKATGVEKLPIGSRVALDVYFKDIYDLDTKFRDAKGKFKLHGDPLKGFQIINEDSGQVITLPPTTQQYGRMDVTAPTGATTSIMAPQTMYGPVGQPAPGGPMTGPGGIPQLGGSGGGIPGIQTKPPEINWQKTESPSGAKGLMPLPKAQAGMPAIQTEPGSIESKVAQGVPVADVGRVNMILQAQDRLSDINSLILPKGQNGPINRDPIYKSSGPLGSMNVGGIGTGATFFSRMYQATDAALRLETGAQANADEIKLKMAEYYPSAKDTDANVKQKLGDFSQYINRVVALHDPTGKLTEVGRAATGQGAVAPTPTRVPGMAPKTADEYLRMRQ